MFGYVTIYEPELKMKDYRKYRGYYCGLCSVLKKKYGSIGQLTLTYDMTFAIILLTSLYECESTREDHRCKAHPVKKQVMLFNKFTEYAADMNIVLSYYHLKDDWEDEKKLSGLAGSAAFHRNAKKIIAKYPRITQNRVTHNFPVTPFKRRLSTRISSHNLKISGSKKAIKCVVKINNAANKRTVSKYSVRCFIVFLHHFSIIIRIRTYNSNIIRRDFLACCSPKQYNK